jgi:hypothetical protein
MEISVQPTKLQTLPGGRESDGTAEDHCAGVRLQLQPVQTEKLPCERTLAVEANGELVALIQRANINGPANDRELSDRDCELLARRPRLLWR